jgi:hypothetical protein
MGRYLNIVSGAGPIMHVLLESKINNTVVGVHAKKLGKATYLTAVTEIMLPVDEEPLIVLTGFDITGYRLENNTLRLSEIQTVIPFNSKFENPFVKNYKNTDSISRN